MKHRELILIKGAGELASGVALRLHHAGYRVIMTEVAQPLAVRRTVAFCEAVPLGEMCVEGVTARRVDNPSAVAAVLDRSEIPVLVDPQAACIPALRPMAVIDAIMAKRNLGTRPTDAPAVVALGPGFVAGLDCHAVVETQRGHFLGRVYYSGSALPDTGVPAERRGHATDRIVRAPASGIFRAVRTIGEIVSSSTVLGSVLPGGNGDAESIPVLSLIDGLLRGLVRDGTPVSRNLKIGDVDPVADPERCCTISDKALSVAGGVLEALLALQ
ncbi:MAG: selenium-dependent molybdenum cofactor biosynthesis protein YqeB [Mycobacterium leprae]